MKDKEGNLTAHLVGLINRSLAFLEKGIKPLWVFDGTPPELKKRTLEKRREAKEKAEVAKEDAFEDGNEAEECRMQQRTVRLTTQMKEDAKYLI